jgi:ribosomal protein S18 acetylase RimI-like enzyme
LLSGRASAAQRRGDWRKHTGLHDPFSTRQLRHTNAFRSVTIYDGKSQLLSENPINRYLVNSPMLLTLKKNADGSLTFYNQKDAPPAHKKSDWLAAPKNFRKYPRYCHLYVIGVLPEAQGKGLASTLMNPVLQAMKEKSIPVFLETANLRNVGIYKKKGFEIFETLTIGDHSVFLMSIES